MNLANSARKFPDDVRVFDRGWLSSTNVLCLGETPALIDTGHVKDAEPTVALVRAALDGIPLADIAHTHLHSDHCGGTAAVQQAWPGARTWVPQASLRTVERWDESRLNFGDTGQRGARFQADLALTPGQSVRLGQRDWQVHAAPGHDPLAVLLFDPAARIVIAGDALWAHGVGVIFPQIEGTDDCHPFARTLDVIEALQPDWVVPGHGALIARTDGGIDAALAQARSRIDQFQAHPDQHAAYAAKVMIKYQLMDVETMTLPDFEAWLDHTPVLHKLHRLHRPALSWKSWTRHVVGALLERGALRQDANHIADCPG